MSTMADTKGRRTRRSFTDDYKTGAVRLVLDEGKTVASAARDLGLTESPLRNWVEQARADRTKGKTGLTTAHRPCTRCPRRIGPSQRPSTAHTRIPTAHRARPWRSRPWTAPTQAVRTDNQCPSRQRPMKATHGGPCARRSHRPQGRLGAFMHNAG